MTVKIGFLDIETAPNLGYSWGKYDQNIISFVETWFLLAFSYKFLGEDKIVTKALPDYPKYKKNKKDDSDLVKDLWKFFNEADIIVAHNGDNFDTKKSNARFITHGLPPPKPYKTVDTLKIARKHFKFDGNRLADLAQYLEVGSKEKTFGFATWEGCIKGDPIEWKRMRVYNAKDITLLEGVYLKLRPWAATHPDLSLYSHPGNCHVCDSTRVQRRGVMHLKTRSYQRLNCQSCGAWFRGDYVKRT